MQHITHTFLSHIVPPIISSYLQTMYVSVNTQCISHCFILQPLPTSNQWTRTCDNDPHTKVLIDRLLASDPLDRQTILHLPSSYCTAIARNLLGLLEGRLVYYKPITTVTNNICRIVVPTFLRRLIFNLIYATPVAGRMGEYKTLYRIKLRFFSLCLRSDVSDWIKQYAHYMLTYRWWRRG